MSILTAEYDFDTAMAVKQEEAYASGRNEGILVGLQQGRDQGAYQTKLETAQKLLARGYEPEDIADLSGLPLSQVHELLPS